MALNLKNAKPRDAIFIGNSRTLYQVSTQYMAEHNYLIYNFGVSGHETPDFPEMVHQALKYHPKAIVLCLAAAYFHTPLSLPKNATLTDIHAYIKSQQPFSYIAKSVLDYTKSFFLINTYAENINIRIRSIANRLSSINSFTNIKNIKHSLGNPILQNKAFQFDKHYVKCKIFRTAHPKKMEALGMCTNGDGVLAGQVNKNSSNSAHVPTNTQQALNQNHLALFNYLIRLIKQSGSKVIVVFTPVYQANLSKNYLNSTAKNIHAPVINLTNLPLSASMWEDKGHLNYRGRHYYSKALLNKLITLKERNQKYEAHGHPYY